MKLKSYFQYKIKLFPGMDIGDSYISDILETSVKTENGSQKENINGINLECQFTNQTK